MAKTLSLCASVPADLDDCARQLADFAGSIRLWLFYGTMGVGKTTFIRSICKILGIVDSVSSPTFALVNEYRGDSTTVYHFDLFRINHQQEAMDFGIEDYLSSGHYCLVEWPEKIPDLLSGEALAVNMTESENGIREIKAVKLNDAYKV